MKRILVGSIATLFLLTLGALAFLEIRHQVCNRKADRLFSAIRVQPVDNSRRSRQMFGLGRTLINNMVVGVHTGFKRTLIIKGVGYRAEVKGNTLVMNIGFSHQIEYTIPKGLDAAVDQQTKVVLQSPDKELLGRVAAEIRGFKPPDPYKGKGIRYDDEVVQRKVGKSA